MATEEDIIATKAKTMKSAIDKTIGSFVDDGKHLIAHQIAHAFQDVSDDTLARFHDIIERL